MENVALPGTFEPNAGITFTSGTSDTPDPGDIEVAGLTKQVTINLVPKGVQESSTSTSISGGRRRRRKTKSKKSKSKSKKRAHPRRRTRYQQ